MATTSSPNISSLSNEANAFVMDKKVSGSKSIEEWLSFFTPIAQFDRSTDVKRRNGNYLKALLAFIAIFGLFMLFLYMFSGAEASSFISPIVVILVFLGLLYLATQYFKKYETNDIPNLLRGFVVPFLKVLQGKIDGSTVLHLNLDLSEIHALENVEVESKKTGKIDYLKASADLPVGGHWELNLDAVGFEVPFFPNYKLRHYLDQHISFDASQFELVEGADPEEATQEGNQIIVQQKYKWQSESPIGMDSGLDQYSIGSKVETLGKMVQRKS